ncbi:MAG: tRNA (cytosine(32)/uridine(32)-2'-O)-methyltransferase TrmJ [Woeseia sp.]|nr:tRNA (cytosine(32)/uridine(32)-2'-O)-methyltransferase TrmJ [Woeseia sp.]
MSIRIVLVGTTHPGNIGAVARAMKNMGFSDLVLVNPRHFPHEDASARASGAEDVLEVAKVVDTLEAALADCHFVVGASARARSIEWPTLSPRVCAETIVRENATGNVAVVMGPEKCGLSNEQIDRCHILLTIPTNPTFSSLNIAMAVQLICYELRLAMVKKPESESEKVPLATGQEMEHFYKHLEATLINTGFLDPNNPRTLMRRLRRLFVRAKMDQNEVNILRGILKAFERQAEKD